MRIPRKLSGNVKSLTFSTDWNNISYTLVYWVYADTVAHWPMLRVDAQDAGELRQRTRQIQLVTRPGNMAIAEIFQIVVNTRSNSHSGAACGDYPVVFGWPEFTHIQAVVGKAAVNWHYELCGSVPEQAFQQFDHCSSLCLATGFRFDMVQSRKLIICIYKNTQHDDQNQAAAASAWHFKARFSHRSTGLKTTLFLHLQITRKSCVTERMVANQKECCCLDYNSQPIIRCGFRKKQQQKKVYKNPLSCDQSVIWWYFAEAWCHVTV